MSIFTGKASELETLVADVEGEIRDLVSHDVAGPQRQPANDGEMVASDLSSLLQRVSAHSVQEIDLLIDELKMLRERLQHEGERVVDEIVAYANLSHTAMQSAKTISERLTHWREGSDPPRVQRVTLT